MKKILARIILFVSIAAAVMLLAQPALATFTLTLQGNVNVDFGTMGPGEWKELDPSSYYHKMVCLTDNGFPWSLQVCFTQKLQSSEVPPKEISLKWLSTYNENLNGPPWGQRSAGTLVHDPSAGYVTFTTPLVNDTVYTSGPGETNNSPNGTAIQMKYGMSIPNNQTAGTYTTVIRYTMTE